MSSSSSSKDYSSALGSLMSTYGTSGTTPTPVHHSTPKSKSHRSSSRKQRDELSSMSPTPSQSSTSLLHKDALRSSEEMEDTLGHLQSQYGLGSFGAGMPVPTMRFNSSSEPKRTQKLRSDKESVAVLVIFKSWVVAFAVRVWDFRTRFSIVSPNRTLYHVILLTRL